MESKFQTRAKIVKALAHPTRLFMVDRILKRERCVRDLTEMVGVDVSTVSKHLAILKKAGVVADERRGLQVCYRIKMDSIRDFLACVDRLIRLNGRRGKR